MKDNSHRSTYFLEAAEVASSSIVSSASTSSPSASLVDAASSSAALSSAFALPFNFATSLLSVVVLVDLAAMGFLRLSRKGSTTTYLCWLLPTFPRHQNLVSSVSSTLEVLEDKV